MTVVQGCIAELPFKTAEESKVISTLPQNVLTAVIDGLSLNSSAYEGKDESGAVVRDRLLGGDSVGTCIHPPLPRYDGAVRLCTELCGLQDRASASQLLQGAGCRLHEDPPGTCKPRRTGHGAGHSANISVRTAPPGAWYPFAFCRRYRWSSSSPSARSANACRPSSSTATATCACTPRAPRRLCSTTAPSTLRCVSWPVHESSIFSLGN